MRYDYRSQVSGKWSNLQQRHGKLTALWKVQGRAHLKYHTQSTYLHSGEINWK